MRSPGSKLGPPSRPAWEGDGASGYSDSISLDARTNVIAVNANTVLATTPPHVAGAVNVAVTTRTGISRVFDAYTYERHDTATLLASSANPSSPGQRVMFTASVTGDGRVARGRVRFMNGAQTLGVVDLRNGVARLATSDLPAGVHTIRAFYLRNGNYARSFGGLRQKVED
jgi:hypothetical protein